MSVNGFFQAVEIWVPDPVESCLRLVGGSYGPHAEFGDCSTNLRFGRGEGLPGRVWETGRPLVLGHLREESGFQRSAAAARAGLVAGMALPVVRKRRVQGVIVLLFGEAPVNAGVAEIWSPTSQGDLRLHSGYFGEFDGLRRLSSALNFELGMGLPGRVWKTHSALLWPDVSREESFLRAAAAASYEITTGLAWACDNRDSSIAVMLATRSTPLARVVEVWAPNDAGNLALVHGEYTDADHLRLVPGSTLSGASGGFIARAHMDGFPTLLTRAADLGSQRLAGAHATHVTRGIALPVVNGERTTSVVVLIS